MSGPSPHALGATSRSAPVIDVKDLRVEFDSRRRIGDGLRGRPAGRVVALDGVTAQVGARETLGLVGESGSGKTTLARALVRLVEARSGAIRVLGRDVLTARGADLRWLRRRIAIVYQDPYTSLNPRLSVGAAIGEAARVHGLVDRDTVETRVGELLELVGLSASVAARRPRELSGGQRQRVAIARALAVEPEALIADEAVSALDVSVQAQVLNLLSELRGRLGLSMLVISHQLPVVAYLCDRVAVLYLGRIVEEGPSQAVLHRPLHPYTEALVASHLTIDKSEERAEPLRGEIPSPLEIPTGCRFRTRCPIAETRCAEVDPHLVAIENGHRAACIVRAPPPAGEPEVDGRPAPPDAASRGVRPTP